MLLFDAIVAWSATADLGLRVLATILEEASPSTLWQLTASANIYLLFHFVAGANIGFRVPAASKGRRFGIRFQCFLLPGWHFVVASLVVSMLVFMFMPMLMLVFVVIMAVFFGVLVRVFVAFVVAGAMVVMIMTVLFFVVMFVFVIAVCMSETESGRR